MRGKHIVGLTSASLVLAVAVALLQGCGGGGGPLVQQPDTGGPPSPSSRFAELLPEAQKDATYVGSEKCLSCHGAGTRQTSAEPIAVAWAKTKHAQVNVGCEQCHGPGSKHVQEPIKGNILGFPRAASSVVCAQCHGTIAAQYERSGHSGPVELVIELGENNPNVYGKGCFRCHSAPFRAQMVDNPLTYGVSREAIHAAIQGMSAAAIQRIAQATDESASCISCHDPHRNTGILTWKGKEVQLRRAELNTDTTDVAPGAPIEKHTAFNQVCAACHNGRGGDPSDAALSSPAGVARPNFHSSNQYNMLMGITGVEEPGGPPVRLGAHSTIAGQCSHCHLPNARHTFTVSYDDGCSPCHTPNDAAVRTQATKTQIEQGLIALRARLQAWSQQQFGDPDLWDYTSLIPQGKTAPPQNQVPIEVKRARHNYWFILRDSSFGIHNPPYTRYLLEVANRNLDRIGAPPGRSRAANLSPATRRAILEGDLQRWRQSLQEGRDL